MRELVGVVEEERRGFGGGMSTGRSGDDLRRGRLMESLEKETIESFGSSKVTFLCFFKRTSSSQSSMFLLVGLRDSVSIESFGGGGGSSFDEAGTGSEDMGP